MLKYKINLKQFLHNQRLTLAEFAQSMGKYYIWAYRIDKSEVINVKDLKLIETKFNIQKYIKAI